jgi:hypothetical protein
MVSSIIAPTGSDEASENQDVIVIAPHAPDNKTSGCKDDEKKLPNSENGSLEDESLQYISGQKRAFLSLSLSLVAFIIGMVCFN